MREPLRQFSLALALPLSVIAVWTVRGDPAGTAPLEFATAYRVQLAELPLPTPERLREPGGETAWQARRLIPEDPSTNRRRLLLPNPPAPPPVDLAAQTDPAIEIADPPSPRTGHPTPGVEPIAPRPALRSAPELVAAVPAIGSRRAARVATAAAASAGPAQAAPESSGAGVSEPTTPAKSATRSPGAVVSTSAAKPARIAAVDTTPARASREIAPTRSLAPVPVPEPARGLPAISPIVGLAKRSPAAERAKTWPIVGPEKSSPIAELAKGSPIVDLAKSWPISTGRVGSDESPRREFENASGYAPLTPPGLTGDGAGDLSLESDAFDTPVRLPDLPMPALETVAASHAGGWDSESAAPDRARGLFASPSTSLRLIPEPGSALLLGAALVAIGTARRIRRRAPQ
jgi:hypothetical protein